MLQHVAGVNGSGEMEEEEVTAMNGNKIYSPIILSPKKKSETKKRYNMQNLSETR